MLEMESKLEEQQKCINRLYEDSSDQQKIIAKLTYESENLRKNGGEQLDQLITHLN